LALSENQSIVSFHVRHIAASAYVKAKFHYTSWFGASSELTPNMFGASSELASVMEFGFNWSSFSGDVQ